MKVAFRQVSDYRPDKHLEQKEKPVWQFLVLDKDAEFISLLHQGNELEQTEEYESLVDSLFNTNEVAYEDNTKGEVQQTIPLKELTFNQSVIGIGVSSTFYKKERVWLEAQGKLPFVYWDMTNTPILEIVSQIELGFSPEDKAFHALHLNLSQAEQGFLYKELKNRGYNNIRFIGDTVLKLKGARFGGLFTDKMVSRFNLAYNYRSNVNSLTQVEVAYDGLEDVDLNPKGYLTKAKSSPKPAQKEVKEPKVKEPKAKKSTVKKTPKPKKEKLSRRNLF